MAMISNTLSVLGPQRLAPYIAEEADGLGIDGPIAAVTAGWQEREAEDDELRAHLRRPVVDLKLHARAEEVFAEDKTFAQAYRARQNTLRRLQHWYRLRLDHVLEPARQLLTYEDPEDPWLAVERSAAIEALRVLDREHSERIREVHAEFDATHTPLERPAIAGQREMLAALLAECAGVVIAGGHVAVLLNRLRLFDLGSLLGDRPVIAWSAGAMALCEQVVLFHDAPPWGAGNAEVLENGLGWLPGVVALPHAAQRLRLDDPQRVALLAHRFAPARCVLLDAPARLRLHDGNWTALDTEVLSPHGGQRPFSGAAEVAS